VLANCYVLCFNVCSFLQQKGIFWSGAISSFERYTLIILPIILCQVVVVVGGGSGGGGWSVSLWEKNTKSNL